MEYTFLGKTGIQVSRLCFGTMSFGGDADESTAKAMFNRCRDAGINFFDTANVYQQGLSEEILGRLMAGNRDELVIASKVHYPMGPDPNAQGLSRRNMIQSVEASLRRLGTDRLDVYFFHGFDPNTPMEESLRAVDDLVKQGKVLYPAVSNWAAWQIAKALGISAREALAPFCCIQPMYNLVKRQAEVEILPLALSEGLAVTPYNPLAAGLLAGKYYDKMPEEGMGRIGDKKMYRLRYGNPAYFETARRFVDHAKEKGVHPVSLAVSWAMHHPGVTAPIIGARNLEQLEPSLKSVDLPMTPEWRREIGAFSEEPAPATDRSEERAGTVYKEENKG